MAILHINFCLQDWCPYMPLARDKPYLFVDGKKEDLSGAAIFTPEWSQQDLVQGEQLLQRTLTDTCAHQSVSVTAMACAVVRVRAVIACVCSGKLLRAAVRRNSGD
jgi:hypothetical protein